METRYKVAVRFLGDDLVPRVISERLRCTPTESSTAGQVLEIRGFSRLAKTGVWLLRDESNGTIDERIMNLLQSCSADVGEWRLTSSEFAGELLLGVFDANVQFGMQLRQETLQEIARRGLLLSLDVYNTLELMTPRHCNTQVPSTLTEDSQNEK